MAAECAGAEGPAAWAGAVGVKEVGCCGCDWKEEGVGF